MVWKKVKGGYQKFSHTTGKPISGVRKTKPGTKKRNAPKKARKGY